MNITEAGKQTSLTPNTLRYYERIGLIPPVARNKGGTREYTSKDLCWIEFIKTMRSAGLSPETLIEYVALSQLGDTSLEARKDIFRTAAGSAAGKIEFIQQTLARIDIKIENYRTDIYQKNHPLQNQKTRGGRPMKNFISMFLMTSLLLGGDDLYNWQNERVCRFKKQD